LDKLVAHPLIMMQDNAPNALIQPRPEAGPAKA
jgi:hypothetical protein